MRRTLPALFLLLLISAPVLADTVPKAEEETILSPILSPVHLRLMGVCEFAFVASDSKLFHKFPATFRRPFPDGRGEEADKTLQFGFEELTLVFDAVSSAKTAGFHGAVLVTGSGSEPDTFSAPALLEAWGYYRINPMQISVGRVRNPFGGRFTDLPEYHMQAVDYRRFRGDGLRLDFDLAAGDLHFHPSVAVLERNHEDTLFFYSGRLGIAYNVKGFGVIGFGASVMYGEDSLRIDSFSYDYDGYWAPDDSRHLTRFYGRYNIRRMDFGFDLSVLWQHPKDSIFGNTEFHAEFIKGSFNDEAFDDDPPDNLNPTPFIGKREPTGWWIEISQWFNYGAGGGPYLAYGYLDRATEEQLPWGIGEQGIVREMVIGYRQAIARGFNVDLEIWIVDDFKKKDSNGAPDYNDDGESDLVQGNFVKVRFQFIF